MIIKGYNNPNLNRLLDIFIFNGSHPIINLHLEKPNHKKSGLITAN